MALFFFFFTCTKRTFFRGAKERIVSLFCNERKKRNKGVLRSAVRRKIILAKDSMSLSRVLFPYPHVGGTGTMTHICMYL